MLPLSHLILAGSGQRLLFAGSSKAIVPSIHSLVSVFSHVMSKIVGVAAVGLNHIHTAELPTPHVVGDTVSDIDMHVGFMNVGWQTQAVCVVVQGGPGTLDTAAAAVQAKTPLVIIEVQPLQVSVFQQHRDP